MHKDQGKTIFLVLLSLAIPAGIAIQGASLAFAATTAHHEQTSGNNSNGNDNDSNNNAGAINNNNTGTAAANETGTMSPQSNETATLAPSEETANNATTSSGNVTVTVEPLVQRPGGTVLVEASGMSPSSNVTIIVDNGLAARSQSDENGTLLYALGVPDSITTVDTRTDSSTNATQSQNNTHEFQGTIKIAVQDSDNNKGTAELTILKPVGQQQQQPPIAGNNNAPSSNSTSFAPNNNNMTATFGMENNTNTTGNMR